MQISVNGNIIEIKGMTDETTLAEMLDTVEESLKGSGTTVVEISVDDKIYSADQYELFQDMKVDSYQKIDFTVVSAKDMVRAAIEDGADGLQHLQELTAEVSDELRIGKSAEAMKKYVEVVDGIEWLSTILKNIEKGFASQMTESSLESDRQALINRLVEQMTEIHDMQATEDWVGMADVLEYEFPEIFDDAGALFKRLLK